MSGEARRLPVYAPLLPDGMLGAVENFKYLLDTERVMQGRV